MIFRLLCVSFSLLRILFKKACVGVCNFPSIDSFFFNYVCGGWFGYKDVYFVIGYIVAEFRIL